MKRSPFAECDGKLFVAVLNSGIHMLVALTDSMTLVRFKGDNRTFLHIEDAIAWHEKERKVTGGKSRHDKVLLLLMQARDEFLNESQAAGHMKHDGSAVSQQQQGG